MKIDFLASYKNVQKLINERPDAHGARAEFEQQLQLESPDSGKQVSENAQQLDKIKQALNANEAEIRAKINFPKQELSLAPPGFEPVDPGNLNSVKESSSGVKTPTGFKARLVKMDNPFDGLSNKERIATVDHLVRKAGLEHGVDPKLGLGVIKAESNFNPVAVSSDGFESKGLMQLLDSTGQEMMSRLGVEENYSPFDPEQNIDLGLGYLKRLQDLFSTSTELSGNLKTFAAANSTSLDKLAVAAYNAGEGRVASAQVRASRQGKDPGQYDNVERYLPETTQQYVKRVMAGRTQFKS